MRLLFVLLAVVSLSACAAKEEIPQFGIKSLSWLEGRWISQDENGQFIEEWREEGVTLKGRGQMVNGTDTATLEQLTILKDTSGLAYVVSFPNREVRFAARKQMDKEEFKHLQYKESHLITFANDTNDFPRDITYRRQNDDSLYITLSGSEAGKPMSMTFKMKRVK